MHLLTTDADQLVRDLVTAGVTFRDLEVRPTSLEEAFLAITGETSDGRPGPCRRRQPAPEDHITAAAGGRPTTA